MTHTHFATPSRSFGLWKYLVSIHQDEEATQPFSLFIRFIFRQTFLIVKSHKLQYIQSIFEIRKLLHKIDEQEKKREREGARAKKVQ